MFCVLLVSTLNCELLQVLSVIFWLCHYYPMDLFRWRFYILNSFSKMSLFALQPWIVSLRISFRLLQLKLCMVRTSRGCGLGCRLEFVLLTLLVFWNWISIVTFRMAVLAFSCDFLLIQDIYFCLLDRSNEHGFPVEIGCISCFYDPSC